MIVSVPAALALVKFAYFSPWWLLVPVGAFLFHAIVKRAWKLNCDLIEKSNAMEIERDAALGVVPETDDLDRDVNALRRRARVEGASLFQGPTAFDALAASARLLEEGAHRNRLLGALLDGGASERLTLLAVAGSQFDEIAREWQRLGFVKLEQRIAQRTGASRDLLGDHIDLLVLTEKGRRALERHGRNPEKR